MQNIREIAKALLNLKYPIRSFNSRRWMYKACERDSFSEDLIYDVGMHTGQDTMFYLKKGFRVIAIEANPVLADKAITRFRPFIDKGQLRIVKVGIADVNSENGLSFFVNENNSEWSSFRKETAARDGNPIHTVIVPTRTLASVVQEYGCPYFVKIDIEDLDRIALSSLLSLPHRPKFVSVENGNHGMLRMLVDAGYDSFKYIQQKNISRIHLEKPAREGEYVGHLFPRGSSGPFGEETPGEWMTTDQIEKEISKVWDIDGGEKKVGPKGPIRGWFDLHARYAKPVED